MARGGMNNAMTERLPALCGANKASLAGKRKRLDAVERARAAGFLRLPDFCRRISCSCALYLGRCGTGDDRLGPCSSNATGWVFRSIPSRDFLKGKGSAIDPTTASRNKQCSRDAGRLGTRQRGERERVYGLQDDDSESSKLGRLN